MASSTLSDHPVDALWLALWAIARDRSRICLGKGVALGASDGAREVLAAGSELGADDDASDDDALVCAGCAQLRRCVFASTDHKIEAVHRGAVSLVCEALRGKLDAESTTEASPSPRTPCSPPAQRALVETLQSLSLKAHPTTVVKLLDADAPGVLAAVLRDAEDAALAEAAVVALAALCTPPRDEMLQAARDGGAALAIESLMTRHSPAPASPLGRRLVMLRALLDV